MSNIVRPAHVAWDFQLSDDGAIEDLLAPNGTRTHVARYSVNSSGGVDGLSAAGDRKYRIGRLQRQSSIGTRIFGGRMGTFDNSTAKTHQVTCSLAQYFDAVRVIFANGNTSSTMAVDIAKVSSQAASSDLNNSSGTWTSLTFGGSASGTIPVAPAANRRGYLVSDWVALSATARSDGGSYPILTIRAYVSTAATITILGNGSDSFTNWATRTPHFWAMRYQNADQVTTPSGFSDTTNRSQSPIVGVQYSARGQVITVMGAGDSITEGRGTYLGEGFGVLACEALSSVSGTAVEWCNIGCSGVGYPTVRSHIYDILAAGIYPDVMVFPNGSPNNLSATMTDAEIVNCRTGTALAIADCRASQVHPVLWTMIPVNPSVKDFGATDSKRVALNADVLSWRTRGVDVMDFDGALSGVTDSDGQVNILTGATTDGIHPNDVGNRILKSIAQEKFSEFLAF